MSAASPTPETSHPTDRTDPSDPSDAVSRAVSHNFELRTSNFELASPVPFLGCRLHPLTTAAFIDLVTGAAREGHPLAITYLNAHCANLAVRHAAYRESINRFSLLYADGKGVVWAARFLGLAVPERVNAGDFIVEFCRDATRQNLRLFLLGGAPGVAERAAHAWQSAAPGLQIVGTHHGYIQEADEAPLARAIEAARPHIVLVGMSAPLQEFWTARWAGRLEGVPVLWCVGALFEYYSGVRARAPQWVRRIGFEWLFRLVLEPRRLWKRYLLGNALFLSHVLRARLGK